LLNFVSYISTDRDSPGLSLDKLNQNIHLERLEIGTGEPAVEDYFYTYIFPDPTLSDSLYRINRNPIAKQVVLDIRSKLKVSIPVPDILYGYDRLGAFP
jgi:hypothetical protein